MVAAVLVHAAACVARGLVAQIEFVVLRDVGQRRDPGGEIGMPGPGAFLAAIGLVGGDLDAHGGASLAAVAIRTVGEDAAAAEAVFDQFGIDVGIDQVRRRGHLRARLPALEVTAGVGRRCVKLQRGKGQVFQVRHGVTESRAEF